MDQTNQLYRAVKHTDADTIKYLLKNGVSPNVMRKEANVFKNRNVGIELIKQGTRSESWDVLDVLLEFGLDVDHQDDDGDTILLYLLDAVRFHQGLFRRSKNIEAKIINKNSVLRIKETFENIMERGPKLSNSFTDIFEYVFKLGALSWFSPFVETMSEKDRELYEGYRLAALLEEPFMCYTKEEGN